MAEMTSLFWEDPWFCDDNAQKKSSCQKCQSICFVIYGRYFTNKWHYVTSGILGQFVVKNGLSMYLHFPFFLKSSCLFVIDAINELLILQFSLTITFDRIGFIHSSKLDPFKDVSKKNVKCKEKTSKVTLNTVFLT